MTKLSDQEIESELNTMIASAQEFAGSHGNVVTVGMSKLARAAFTLGKDHGEACIIERAAGLVAVDAEREKEAGIGRAVMVLTMWTLLHDGRSWNVNHHTEQPSVWLNAGAGEFLGSDICGPKGYHYESGADLFEAFAKIEKWCTEHASIVVSRDTEPAPAMTESEHVHRAAVAGVTIDQLITAPTAGDVYERMLESVSGPEVFEGAGGDFESPPSTERNL